MLNNCSGDIIVRGCGDDIHKPHRVSATVAAFNENPGTHILCGCWDLINEDGSPSIKTHKVIFENHLLTNSFTQYNQLQCFLISKQFGGYWGVTAAYRRSVFTQFDELPDDIIHDDTLMSFRGLLLGKGLWLKDYLVDYRRRSGQVTDGGGGDLYHREKKMALSSKNDLVMTVCYGKDLSRFVSQATSELDYKGIVAMINNEAMWRDLHANWWDYSYVKRLAIFYKLIFSRDRVPRDFMARRILPYALFPLNNMVVNSAITLKRGLGL